MTRVEADRALRSREGAGGVPQTLLRGGETYEKSRRTTAEVVAVHLRMEKEDEAMFNNQGVHLAPLTLDGRELSGNVHLLVLIAGIVRLIPRFRIIEDEGEVCLGVPVGGIRLRITDDNGKLRLGVLVVDEVRLKVRLLVVDEAHLRITENNGKVRLGVLVDEVHLRITDNNGKTRL